MTINLHKALFPIVAFGALLLSVDVKAAGEPEEPGIETGPLPALVEKPSEQSYGTDSHGTVILGPAVTYHGSGPYRAVYSANAFSAIRSSVALPCNAAQVREGEELGYIYLGGWGAGTYGKAVDAGLQKGRVADGNPIHDYYRLILNYEGHWHVPTRPLKIACGQTVDLTFEADADGKLRLSTQTVNAINDSGTPVVIPTRELIEVPVNRGDGWLPGENQRHNGTLVKRMVTIGQPLCWFARNLNGKGMHAVVHGWNTDGSYFGHHPGSLTPLIHWTHTEVGAWNTFRHAWEWTKVSSTNVVRKDVYPAGNVTVTPDPGGAGGEFTSIDLQGTSSPAPCN